jgi:hypothetical protein
MFMLNTLFVIISSSILSSLIIWQNWHDMVYFWGSQYIISYGYVALSFYLCGIVLDTIFEIYLKLRDRGHQGVVHEEGIFHYLFGALLISIIWPMVFVDRFARVLKYGWSKI